MTEENQEVSNTESTSLSQESTTQASLINGQVQSLLTGSTDQVRERVINHLVEKALTERTELVVQALKNLKEAENNVRKIKPDQTVKDADGKVIQAGYSETTYKQLEEARKKVEQYRNAIEAALTKNDFSKLQKA